MEITIRRAEPGDFEAMYDTYLDPGSYAGTLQPAIALYRKFGFEIEGTHKAYALRDGRYVDAYAMARIRAKPSPL